MENNIAVFNEKIRLLLERGLLQSSLDIDKLTKEIEESEENVRACFDNAAKCQPRILFKISKALGVEHEMMMLMSFGLHRPR